MLAERLGPRTGGQVADDERCVPRPVVVDARFQFDSFVAGEAWAGGPGGRSFLGWFLVEGSPFCWMDAQLGTLSVFRNASFYQPSSGHCESRNTFLRSSGFLWGWWKIGLPGRAFSP